MLKVVLKHKPVINVLNMYLSTLDWIRFSQVNKYYYNEWITNEDVQDCLNYIERMSVLCNDEMFDKLFKTHNSISKARVMMCETCGKRCFRYWVQNNKCIFCFRPTRILFVSKTQTKRLYKGVKKSTIENYFEKHSIDPALTHKHYYAVKREFDHYILKLKHKLINKRRQLLFYA